MEDKQALVQWLLEEGGPAIRYRTATELMHTPPSDVTDLIEDLVTYSMVQTWVDRLKPVTPGSLTNLHGSHPDAFENVCAKLYELGIRRRMVPAYDAGLAPYRRYAAHGVQGFGELSLMAPLNLAGYGDDEAIQTYFAQRLDGMYALAQSGTYDITIDHDTFGDCPATVRKRPLINPEFYDQLPFIWDIYALAHYPASSAGDETARRIETVIAYILHPDYQALDDGYGYMRAGPRRYFSIGWSVHLPGYDGFDFDGPTAAGTFVQRLELMAHFPIAVRSAWFRHSLDHLENFRTDDGTYRFPAAYLREQSSGYWVTGAYMRLEENRRRRIALTLDSTFRMCKIKRLMERHDGQTASDCVDQNAEVRRQALRRGRSGIPEDTLLKMVHYFIDQARRLPQFVM